MKNFKLNKCLEETSRPPKLLGGLRGTVGSGDYQPDHLHEAHGYSPLWYNSGCGFCPFFKIAI